MYSMQQVAGSVIFDLFVDWEHGICECTRSLFSSIFHEFYLSTFRHCRTSSMRTTCETQERALWTKLPKWSVEFRLRIPQTSPIFSTCYANSFYSTPSLAAVYDPTQNKVRIVYCIYCKHIIFGCLFFSEFLAENLLYLMLLIYVYKIIHIQKYAILNPTC